MRLREYEYERRVSQKRNTAKGIFPGFGFKDKVSLNRIINLRDMFYLAHAKIKTGNCMVSSSSTLM